VHRSPENVALGQCPLAVRNPVIVFHSRIPCRSFHAKERSHMLLTGGRGSGKTSLSLHLAAKLQRDPDVRVFVIRIAGGELAELRTGALRARLDEMRHSAILNGPTLLLVDDLDKVFILSLFFKKKCFTSFFYCQLVPQGSQENKGAQRQSDEKAHLVCGWLEQLVKLFLEATVLRSDCAEIKSASHHCSCYGLKKRAGSLAFAAPACIWRSRRHPRTGPQRAPCCSQTFCGLGIC